MEDVEVIVKSNIKGKKLIYLLNLLEKYVTLHQIHFDGDTDKCHEDKIKINVVKEEIIRNYARKVSEHNGG